MRVAHAGSSRERQRRHFTAGDGRGVCIARLVGDVLAAVVRFRFAVGVFAVLFLACAVSGVCVVFVSIAVDMFDRWIKEGHRATFVLPRIEEVDELDKSRHADA